MLRADLARSQAATQRRPPPGCGSSARATTSSSRSPGRTGGWSTPAAITGSRLGPEYHVGLAVSRALSDLLTETATACSNASLMEVPVLSPLCRTSGYPARVNESTLEVVGGRWRA